ncbi:hypothetical protein U9M48_021366 [Paspalum notatum var. saurae]|uniref:DUF1618 domain-containing protein n=1 Tax=Paspalum notatum var. saurae TaxID=547442 RepID=A0AAQ3TH92_PASNO
MKGIDELLRAWDAARASAPAAAALEEKETHTSSSRSRRTRSGSSRRPSHVLLNVAAVVGVHPNRTTAKTLTSKGLRIEVSFLMEPPPQPSTVFVASDDLNPFVPPVVLCSVDDLLLLRVNVGRKRCHVSLKHCHDYYVYRACTDFPVLDLLQSPPNPVFHRDDVGLLPRPDGRYTVASLMDIGRDDVYELQLYHSDTSTWTSREVSVEPPQWHPLPEGAPKFCGCLLRHYTSAVITIGREGGTMAWVDLWRSVLLCDVLRPDSCLRAMPVPLPSRQMGLNDGLGVRLDFAAHSRAISFNRGKGCLTLVHLERFESPDPFHAATRGRCGQDVQVLDWELTTWSNSKMSLSQEDWHEEHTVKASNITIDDPAAVSRMLEDFRSLPPPREHSDDEAVATATAAAAAAAPQAQKQLEFHNLSMCQPHLVPNGEDVVYLVAREKYLDPKAWLVAVDMKKGTLKRVSDIGNQGHPFCHRIHCLTRISKYTNPRKRLMKSSATDPVSVDEEESNYQAGAVE